VLSAGPEAGRRVRIAVVALALLGALAAPGGRAAQAQTYSEDAVKAAFLYRFAGYVDWPAAALVEPQFTIAVLDAGGVAGELGRLLQNRRVQDRPAQVRSIKSIRELNNAQMLYVGASHREDLRRLIAGLSGRPVLVVTNEDDGLDAGSTVNFLLIDQRVRFEISVDAAQSAGLKVASELLAVALRVRGKRVYSEAGCEQDGTSPEVMACIREAAQR
jgi:YfiR/HmsC-like